jgi:hypothetical protein
MAPPAACAFAAVGAMAAAARASAAAMLANGKARILLLLETDCVLRCLSSSNPRKLPLGSWLFIDSELVA